MRVEIKQLPGSQIELTIELPREEFEPYYKKAVGDLSRAHPVKGFRPGNVPREVLEKNIGPERVFSKTVDLAVKESYVRAILEHKLRPVGEPKIEVGPNSAASGLNFKVSVAVLPKVSLPDYRVLKVKKEKIEVPEKEVDSALKTLQKSRAVYATVTRPAAQGDRVEIDFTSSISGVPIEGGTSQQHPLVLGEGHFMAGFEEELVGMKEGEQKKFSKQAPENYYQPALAGKKIDFAVTMRLVQSVSLPNLDDDFAKSIGKFSSLADLKKSIGEGIYEEKKMRAREKVRLELVEKIIANAPTIELPDIVVDQELEKMEQELYSSLARMGLNKEDYLAHIKKDPGELKKSWHAQAEKRVKAALVLAKIAEEKGIAVTDEEVTERVNELIKSAPAEEADRLDPETLKSYVRGLIRNERVFEHLEEEMVDPVSGREGSQRPSATNGIENA